MAERGRPRSFDRDAALERAMEVFWAKGYEGASMTDLTGAMGIASPSLYAAFNSKETLFREAVALYGALEGPALWSVVETAPTAREAIEGYLMATAAAFSRPDKPAGCLVVLSAVNAAGAGEAVCAELRADRARGVARIERRLRRAIDAGELPSGADTRAIATFYITVQQGMSIQARDGATRATLETVARSAMAAWPVLSAAVMGAVANPDTSA